MSGSPFDATPEQLVALWDVADSAKTLIGFMHGFFTRGSNRKAVGESVLKLGRALDALDRLRGEE